MKLKFYDQIPSTQITLSIRELVILQLPASKLFAEDKIYEYALPTLCNGEDSELIVEFAKELREELDTLVDKSVLTLLSKNLNRINKDVPTRDISMKTLPNQIKGTSICSLGKGISPLCRSLTPYLINSDDPGQEHWIT